MITTHDAKKPSKTRNVLSRGFVTPKPLTAHVHIARDKSHRLCEVKSRLSYLNTSSTMRLRNWIIFLSLPLVGVGILYITSNQQSCERPLSTSDQAVLEEIAFNTMKERPTELSFLGLEPDASDLVFSNIRSTSRELTEDQTIDHPVDLATLFLYAEINGHNYMFSFDDCGQLLNMANRSGFDIEMTSEETS